VCTVKGMGRIRILPDVVANRIAAGEVVERPAGVVRELVENSLDAGARRINVEFRHGGRSLMKVEDDGCGMTPDDAVTALERHATSKLREAEDLMAVRTMGFRGEALPSIASVSRMQLRTRTSEAEGGVEVLINGGKLIHRRECGMPVGTQIEVSHLFHSVPARRKFLKTDATEAAHIVRLCRLYALAHPGVHFSLVEDGREIFRSPQCEDLGDRVGELWGRQLARELEPLNMAEEPGLRLRGLLGRPGRGRSSRSEMIVLLNGRPVDARALSWAIAEAYHTHLPRGRYPLAFLFLEVDPAQVDVNVHPAKREVRFREEGRVRQFVLRTLSERLAELARPAMSTVPKAAPALPNGVQPAAVAPPVNGATPQLKRPAIHELREYTPPIADNGGTATLVRPPVAQPTVKPTEATPQKATGWTFLARLDGRHALLRAPDGLVVLHLRAAHERILYERILGEFQDGKPPVQPLLLPAPLELDPVRAQALEERLETLETCGFSLERFGRHFYRLSAVPQWLKSERPEEYLRDLLGAVLDGTVELTSRRVAHETLARHAARRAVRVNEAADPAAVQHLVRELLSCNQPATCPGGKPVFIEMTHADLARRFGRD